MSNTLINVGIIIAFFAVFYFLLIRPQQMRQKERQTLIKGLAAGDKVITVGGIIGVIKNLGEETLVLQTGKDIELEVSRGAIASKYGSEERK